MSTAQTKVITADELLKMGDIGRCELIYGELVMMSRAGFGHGEIASRLDRFIGSFVEENDLGVTLGAETGYLVESDPDLVRAPDVSFVKKSRVPRKPFNKYFRGAPDMAAEVLSPDDTKRDISEKANMWLAHGTTSVWIADPATMTITIQRTGKKAVRLGSDDELSDEPTLPGFVMPLSRVYKRR